MKELITRGQAEELIWAIGALGVILGTIAAIRARRKGQDAKRIGALFGGPPVLLFLMWRVYNAVEDHFGLDSIAALSLNFVLFVLIGAACGIGWALWSARTIPNSHSASDGVQTAKD